MLCKIPLATALRSTPPQEFLPSRAERNAMLAADALRPDFDAPS